MHKRALIFAPMMGILIFLRVACAEELVAKILRPQPSKQLDGFTISPDEAPIQLDSNGPFVEIHGIYVAKDRTLIFQNRRVDTDNKGNIRFHAKLVDQTTPVVIKSIDPFGKVSAERILLQTSVPFSQLKAQPVASHPLSVSIGAGATYLIYRESGVVDYNSVSATPKIAISYRFHGSPWELGASSYLTAFALTKNQVSMARFLGINGRVGYRIHPANRTWSLSFLAGWYYTTMFVSDDAFGFQNMQGPQLFPTASFAVSPHNHVSAYLKFSPVTDGFSPLSLSNRELAIGGAFTHGLSHERSVSVSLDLATFALTIHGRGIQSSSATLGASYGF